MLVCNVSLLRRRASIAVGLVEAAAALDAPGTGNVVFATLVDDPASVGDRVDAYLGEIMLEAASASSTVNAGLVYSVAVFEAAAAADTANAGGGYAVAIDEAATAVESASASVTAPSILTATVVEMASATDTPDAALVSAVMRSAMVAGLSPMRVNSGVPPIKSSTLNSGTSLGA